MSSSRRFCQTEKKLTKRQITQLDEALRTIIANPEMSTLKTGDLNGGPVYKFRIDRNQILLAYEIVESTMFLARYLFILTPSGRYLSERDIK